MGGARQVWQAGILRVRRGMAAHSAAGNGRVAGGSQRRRRWESQEQDFLSRSGMRRARRWKNDEGQWQKPPLPKAAKCSLCRASQLPLLRGQARTNHQRRLPLQQPDHGTRPLLVRCYLSLVVAFVRLFLLSTRLLAQEMGPVGYPVCLCMPVPAPARLSAQGAMH